MLLSESSLGDQGFPPFKVGFPPWDAHEPPFLFQTPTHVQDEEPVFFNPQTSAEPVSSNSSSYNTDPALLKPNPKNSKTLTSGSIMDERKRRRMISNRESARRSRMRKQKHLENLRNQLNRLRIGNRELMNRVRLAVHHNQLIRWENEHFRSEAVMLRQKLWDISQVLLVRQLQQHLNSSAWPCNNNTSIIEGQLAFHSLIT